ncbi:MAG: hypothetical protein ACYDBJ_06090 [Aggregatilineales bacterium]
MTVFRPSRRVADPPGAGQEQTMDFNLDQWLKLTENLSFTSFLILCVGVLAYALYRLYLYSRTDWNQIQQNTQDIAQLNQTVATLVAKIDQLITQLHVTNHTSQASIAAALRMGPIPPADPANGTKNP